MQRRRRAKDADSAAFVPGEKSGGIVVIIFGATLIQLVIWRTVHVRAIVRGLGGLGYRNVVDISTEAGQ